MSSWLSENCGYCNFYLYFILTMWSLLNYHRKAPLHMKFLIGIFLAMPLLANAANGVEFSGKWIHTKYASLRVEIADNKSSYLVTEHNEAIAKKHVAKLVDGVLTVNMGPCGINADIEKKSGNLVFGGAEYRRLKPGESFDYVKKGVPRF